VGNYVLSRQADADIEAIAEFSLQRWGLTHAERYILGLHEMFRMPAAFPDPMQCAQFLFRHLAALNECRMFRTMPGRFGVLRRKPQASS
jgi:hypothetical protein